MKKIFAKKEVAMGLGAGVGVIVPSVLERYVDPQGPLVEGWDSWGKWSVLFPIASGAILFYIASATKLIKKNNVKDFTKLYSITAFLSGIMRGIFTGTAGLGTQYGYGNPRTEAQRRATHFARFGTTNVPPRGTGQYWAQYGMSPTALPEPRTDIRSVRAKGWGSDPHFRPGTFSQFAVRQTHFPPTEIIA